MISVETVTPELKDFINAAFEKYALAKTGMHDLKDPVAFVVYEGDKKLGTVIAQMFWGQLHIKTALIDEEARGKGTGRTLMEQAHAYGRENGANFSYVETMSFQAQGFYEKLGYKKQYVRDGHSGGTSMIYLKKELNDA
jgi:ribosomal protein S18 acetylase RimI-like enzyme